MKKTILSLEKNQGSLKRKVQKPQKRKGIWVLYYVNNTKLRRELKEWGLKLQKLSNLIAPS